MIQYLMRGSVNAKYEHVISGVGSTMTIVEFIPLLVTGIVFFAALIVYNAWKPRED